jgi:hypothetical protein
MDPVMEEIHDGETVALRSGTPDVEMGLPLGRGGQGMGPEPAEHLRLGYCTVTAVEWDRHLSLR